MDAFAAMENDLNGLLIEFLQDRTGVNDGAIWSATIGGMRLKPLKDTFNRVLRAVNAPNQDCAEVAKVLSQMGEIQFLRDKLAHNAAWAEIRDGEWWFGTTNLKTARERDQIELIFFRTETLRAATRDLERAHTLIDRVLNKAFWQEVDETIERENLEPEDHIRLGPWHYRPSMLAREGPKHSPKRERSSRPHRASKE